MQLGTGIYSADFLRGKVVPVILDILFIKMFEIVHWRFFFIAQSTSTSLRMVRIFFFLRSIKKALILRRSLKCIERSFMYVSGGYIFLGHELKIQIFLVP